jgi:hypothetical protein
LNADRLTDRDRADPQHLPLLRQEPARHPLISASAFAANARLVHLCTTAAEVKLHSKARHCVAIKLRNEPQMLLGDISHFDG